MIGIVHVHLRKYKWAVANQIKKTFLLKMQHIHLRVSVLNKFTQTCCIHLHVCEENNFSACIKGIFKFGNHGYWSYFYYTQATCQI